MNTLSILSTILFRSILLSYLLICWLYDWRIWEFSFYEKIMTLGLTALVFFIYVSSYKLIDNVKQFTLNKLN